MAEITSRERHVAEIKAVQQELKRLKMNTPHRRDVDRRLKRLRKELLIYDRYQGRLSTWQGDQKRNMISSSLST